MVSCCDVSCRSAADARVLRESRRRLVRKQIRPGGPARGDDRECTRTGREIRVRNQTRPSVTSTASNQHTSGQKYLPVHSNTWEITLYRHRFWSKENTIKHFLSLDLSKSHLWAILVSERWLWITDRWGVCISVKYISRFRRNTLKMFVLRAVSVACLSKMRAALVRCDTLRWRCTERLILTVFSLDKHSSLSRSFCLMNTSVWFHENSLLESYELYASIKQIDC